MKRLLVANRGEIACRILASAKKLCLETVAVYSDADTQAMHRELADQSLHLGAADALSSYANIDRVLEAARISGADAIHPGYGFLSENAEFAERCERKGILFVGPPVEALKIAGSKLRSRVAARQLGIPILQGSATLGNEKDESAVSWHECAENLGYPVLIKASAGGGGRGIRLVEAAAQLEAAIDSARREALRTFGNEEIFLEKYLRPAAHVEVQLMADNHGNCVHLYERDCSVQRRHQKIIEESPSPRIDDSLRDRLTGAAVKFARSIDYVNAGTVEFLIGEGGDFYFLEINPRLQVEHAVTEELTGIDLVEWQLRVAAGEALPLPQEKIEARGWAMEARLCAEDPRHGLLPQTGTLRRLELPAKKGIRVDAGLQGGDGVSENYDSLIGKIIASGRGREECRQRLVKAIAEELLVVGLATNAPCLVRVLEHRIFTEGAAQTDFFDDHDAELLRPAVADHEWLLLAAAVIIASRHAAPADSVWRNDGWRLRAGPRLESFVFSGSVAGSATATFAPGSDEIHLQTDFPDSRHEASGRPRMQDGHFLLEGADLRCHAYREGRQWVLTCRHEVVSLTPGARPTGAQAGMKRPDDEAAGAVVAPLTGTLNRYHVQKGDEIVAGTPLLAIESMKMEHVLRATAAGVVKDIRARVGATIRQGDVLLTTAPRQNGPEDQNDAPVSGL